jgi:hypothetical protein
VEDQGNAGGSEVTEKEKQLWEKVYFEALFGNKLVPDPGGMATKAIEDLRSANARLFRAARTANS